jgi:hypothetical protein
MDAALTLIHGVLAIPLIAGVPNLSKPDIAKQYGIKFA